MRKAIIIVLAAVILLAAAAAGYIQYMNHKNETKFTMVTQSDQDRADIAKENTVKKEAPAEIKSENYALHKDVTASGNTEVYVAENAVDGDVYSYWEGENNKYPCFVAVDLGKPTKVKILRIKLNPKPIWEKRTQTFSILGSDDGSTYKPIVEADDYEFDPDTSNTVTVEFDPVETRYVKVEFTANTAAKSGQIAELEVY